LTTWCYPLLAQTSSRADACKGIYFLNMEGTKHEKAVLVILSYIVGLTSGFIAFGLTQGTPTLETNDVVLQYEVPVVNASETTQNDALATPPTTTAATQVTYQDGRLTVDKNDSVQVLSVERNRLNLEAASYFTIQGTHSSELVYSVSPDTNYVYFCEQETKNDQCNSFVYDVQNETIHYVRSGDVKTVLTSAEARRVAWVNESLVIGQNASPEAATPWLLSLQ